MLALRQKTGFESAATLQILVLDDDSFDRKRVRRWVERADLGIIELSEAADLKGLEEQMARQEFDLILVDFGLTDGTGLDALDMLRQSSLNRDAFVAMISGREDEGLRATCLSQGCDAFFTKSELDPNAVKMLIETVSANPMQRTALPARKSQQSALEFWRDQAHKRAKYDAEHGRPSNSAVLAEIFMLRKPTAPETSSVEAVATQVDEHVSKTLRMFIEDFLAVDEFEYHLKPVDTRDPDDDGTSLSF